MHSWIQNFHLDDVDLFLIAKWPVCAIFWAATCLRAAYALNPITQHKQNAKAARVSITLLLKRIAM